MDVELTSTGVAVPWPAAGGRRLADDGVDVELTSTGVAVPWPAAGGR